MENNEMINKESMVRVSQAAALLGVSSRTIWRMIAEGQLMAVRFRRCTRLPLAQLYALQSGGKAVAS